MAVSGKDLAFLQQSLPFWKSLSPEQQSGLAEAVTPRVYQKGESVHNGSADCLGLTLVQSGQVRAFILSETGKEITLYRLFERDVCLFSASCIMRNINFDVYMEAEQESRILLIPTHVYETLSKHSLAVADYTSQLLSSRFSDVMWVMEQVLFMSFDKRLALFLLEQSAIDGSDTLAITHEAIARHMGSAREVVTRMLKYFQSEGMVALSRGGLTISDRKKLESLTA